MNWLAKQYDMPTAPNPIDDTASVFDFDAIISAIRVFPVSSYPRLTEQYMERQREI